jgi:hypothetical protein
VLDMLREALPGAQVLHVDVRFLANVFARDRVIAAGRVEHVEDGRATCAVWLDVEGGARALDGTATLILPTDRGET